MSTTGGICREPLILLRKAARIISFRKEISYSYTMSKIQRRLSFAVPRYVLLEYYTVIFCEFRESGSPFSETFVPAKSDTSANVNEATNTLDMFTNPYEATDTSDTFTNANEAKDLLDIEGETRVIRFWLNRMIKLGFGIEDDADELLARKSDTAAVPADESDATRMEDADYQMKRY
ncbi:hypothetical protein GJ496_009062 [Pomphorhynchus laevis]|nr:hypothetical protein GJ496_009062 [Pomphorhynchus laevis]